jgi:fatty-acyl-CoA synthase
MYTIWRMETVAELLRRRVGDEHVGLLFEDQRWTWAQCLQEMARRANWLQSQADAPGNIGVLLENTPEFHFWLGACALTGTTLVGLNPTRSGPELCRDIEHTECRFVIADDITRPLLADLAPVPVFAAPDEPALPSDTSLPEVVVTPSTGYLLIFTSGTTSAPRAVICTQGRLGGIAVRAAERFGLTPDDVAYGSMPMFHSNALMACWGPALAAGATLALRRKFSASNFLPDVRRFGATYANYVGKPLAYILATPEQPDDADNPLNLVFGNEAAHADVDEFSRRFNCIVIDGYGSTEGAIALARVPGMPPGAIGQSEGSVVIRNSATGEACPSARFDDNGRLVNAAEAIGEITAPATNDFEGYYNNAEANAQRVRDGIYWSGDLGYLDDQGYIYFAGRTADWLRVDGENLAVGPIERVLARFDAFSVVAVYGVPDPVVGDAVMLAAQIKPGHRFDPGAFVEFLAAQPDLGTKAAPCFVRATPALPITATNKVRKQDLRKRAWAPRAGDEVWWSPDRDGRYRPFDENDDRALVEAFERRDRADALIGLDLTPDTSAAVTAAHS